MKMLLSAFACAVAIAAVGANTFRVTPYVQHPKPDAMTVMWLANESGDATFSYWKEGTSAKTQLRAVLRCEFSSDTTGRRFTADDTLEYCQAPELGYGLSPNNDDAKVGGTAPYQYRVRVTGLEADTVYRYSVSLADGATYADGRFRTSPSPNRWRSVKFIYFSDSETQPEDNTEEKGYTTDWDIPTGSPRTSAKYFATQTEAYAANLRAAVDFGSELIVMAGDLAQKGSKQCDWDEFWRHNAGDINAPAASIPIVASPGNHDYWSYDDGGNVGITKYLSYFEYEPNQANVGDRQHELFHRVDYGPVTFLFMDACNGNDDVLSEDTSRHLSRKDADGYGNRCIAPDFNPGSEMHKWLEEQLKDAQRNSAFTFVVCHQCPYSCGYHGGEIVERGTGGGKADDQTGRALRVLEPLFHKYGVDGWLCGHDEMMERSEIEGTETLPDGTEVPHKFCVWDMGIAGDGLRGNVVYNNVNPREKYRAHVDCPEVYEDGVLVEGGKHYGHLEVTIDQAEDGSWRATFDPVYIFYSGDKSGKTVYGGVRHYADKVIRISNRCKKDAPPAPQPVTKTRVDVSTYVPTKMPQGLVTTFYDGPNSRGFSWQTDTSVTETKLWVLKGEYDQDDGNVFVRDAQQIEGVCDTVNDPALNCHRAHVDGLGPGVYSYRLGGGGYYVYGRFEVRDAPTDVTLVNFNDVQTKDASLLYLAENAIAAAARTAATFGSVDFLVNGGDFIDLNNFNNAGNPHYAIGYRTHLYFKWGVTVDTVLPYFPGVPLISATGIHDAAQYTFGTDVAYGFPAVHGGGCQSVDYGDVHVATLAYPGDWGAGDAEFDKMYRWLDADLRTAVGSRWKVVAMHYGPYTTGDHAQDAGTPAFARLFAPMLSSNHVDLVLQAHDHTYSKTVPYRWDTLGYTSSATDETVLNLDPAQESVAGFKYDLNPRGTYYVSCGCCGHRVFEGVDYARADGANSYRQRDPAIAVGSVNVDSKWKKIGDPSSDDFNAQMFGVLTVRGKRLAYRFYAVEADGTTTLVDALGVSKTDAPEKGSGFGVFLK